jgi:hypothetical protein
MFDSCCCGFPSVTPSSDDISTTTNKSNMLSSFLSKGSSSLSSKDTKRPSVYEESVSMLAGSLIIYFFADIRDMARAGEISTPLEDLSPPLTADKVLAAIEGNEEALAKRAISHDDLKKRLEALHTLKEHQGGLFQKLFSPNTKAKTVMTHFVDTKGEGGACQIHMYYLFVSFVRCWSELTVCRFSRHLHYGS